MPGVTYATTADFKDWVGLTDAVDDDTIERALLAASRGIEQFCDTRFYATTAGTVRFFDSCYLRWVRIGDAVAVTQVATDTTRDGTFATVWTAADFQLLPLNPAAGPETEPFTEIHAIKTLTFPRPAGDASRLGLIRVTGTFGWPTVPDAIVQSTLFVANRHVKHRGSPEGVAGLDEFGPIRVSSRDDPEAVRLLTPYRTSRRAGGWAFA